MACAISGEWRLAKLLLESGLKFGSRKRAKESINTNRHVAGWAVLLAVAFEALAADAAAAAAAAAAAELLPWPVKRFCSLLS